MFLQDEKNIDLKTLPWRDSSSNAITPPASESGSSIAGDDYISTQLVKVAFTTSTTIYQQTSNNGHKKLNRSQSEPRARYNKHNSGGSASLRWVMDEFFWRKSWQQCFFFIKLKFGNVGNAGDNIMYLQNTKLICKRKKCFSFLLNDCVAIWICDGINFFFQSFVNRMHIFTW